MDEDAVERGTGDLVYEGDIELLAEGGGGEVVGSAAKVAYNHLLGAGRVHAPPPLFYGDTASTTV
jgi:hypothetical protein